MTDNTYFLRIIWDSGDLLLLLTYRPLSSKGKKVMGKKKEIVHIAESKKIDF